MKTKNNFEIPEEYNVTPCQDCLDKGYFIQTEPKLFPDGIVRFKNVMTKKGEDYRLKCMLEDVGAVRNLKIEKISF